MRGLLCGLGLPGSLEGPLCWGRLALTHLPEGQLTVNSLPWAQAPWLDVYHLPVLPSLVSERASPLPTADLIQWVAEKPPPLITSWQSVLIPIRGTRRCLPSPPAPVPTTGLAKLA